MTELSQSIKSSMCSPAKQHFIVGWNDTAHGINTSRSKEIRDTYLAEMEAVIPPDTREPHSLGILAAISTFRALPQSKLFRLEY